MTDSSASSASDDPSTTQEDGSPDDAQRDLYELVGELRAEITRLKAQEAKARAKSWIQRHPLLTVALSIGVGTAAGYGASTALRPGPRPSLSDRARQRLRELSSDARDVAFRLGDRATRSGADLRNRAQATGRRLADEARDVGESAQREAKEFARTASDRLREATDEATRRVQERGEEVVSEAREFGDALGERASDAVGEYSESISDGGASRLAIRGRLLELFSAWRVWSPGDTWRRRHGNGCR